MDNNRENQEVDEDLDSHGDLGLTNRITQANRIINQDGTFNVIRDGHRFWTPYQYLVEVSWPLFLLLVLLSYIGVNILFGIAYCLVGVETLSGIDGGTSFWDQLAHTTFFSVQTFTTVGYGAISPTGILANIIASLNALIGLIGLALVTGLIFARFAKPKAHILISDCALIAPYEGGTSFQFRIANKRNSKIIDLEAIAIYSWIDSTQLEARRQYRTLALERHRVALFPLNWTIVHPIVEGSPLWGMGVEDMERNRVEFVVQIKGFDETYGQFVHLNSSYLADEIHWNVHFRRMYEFDSDRGTVLHLDLINDIVGELGELGDEDLEKN
ncbi:MAG: ion transporter [Bacteroidota bacterium]